ncbi:MAG: hypothetical protein GY941_23705 [Planctomycetes bacterium]|nr:hypothetical protein [Planctomycetota bacterium]
MISLSTIEASTNEGIVLEYDDSADYRENTSRITRVKTLDGGVHITHSGVVDGDRTLRVDADIIETLSDILWDFYNDNTFIHVSTQEGFYIAAISEMQITNNRIKMIILIKSKEA